MAAGRIECIGGSNPISPTPQHPNTEVRARNATAGNADLPGFPVSFLGPLIRDSGERLITRRCVGAKAETARGCSRRARRAGTAGRSGSAIERRKRSGRSFLLARGTLHGRAARKREPGRWGLRRGPETGDHGWGIVSGPPWSLEHLAVTGSSRLTEGRFTSARISRRGHTALAGLHRSLRTPNRHGRSPVAEHPRC